MTTRRWKYLLPCLILAVPAAMAAQGSRSGFFPWWDSPMVVNGLDLTQARPRKHWMRPRCTTTGIS